MQERFDLDGDVSTPPVLCPLDGIAYAPTAPSVTEHDRLKRPHDRVRIHLLHALVPSVAAGCSRRPIPTAPRPEEARMRLRKGGATGAGAVLCLSMLAVVIARSPAADASPAAPPEIPRFVAFELFAAPESAG
jgi:hypothetical protein